MQCLVRTAATKSRGSRGAVWALAAILLLCAFLWLSVFRRPTLELDRLGSGGSSFLLRHGEVIAEGGGGGGGGGKVFKAIAGGRLKAIPVPPCAIDVIVPLYRTNHAHRHGQNYYALNPPMKDDENCHGLLLRNDLVLTSADCARGGNGDNNGNKHLLVNIPGFGFVPAMEDPDLSKKSVWNGTKIDPRLGFVRIDQPVHHHGSGSSIMGRRRMFLSTWAKHKNGTLLLPVGCHNHRPVAHSVLVNGDLVPVGPLRRLLPDLLWKQDVDVYSAPELTDGKQRWWIQPTTYEQEQQRTVASWQKYKGPPGSIDIIRAQTDYIAKASAAAEVQDPRGHRKDCFEPYYKQYANQLPFSGESFFDWLDYGRGRDPERLAAMLATDETMTEGYLRHCRKERFDNRHVYYFSDTERLEHAVDVVPSKDRNYLTLRYKKSGQLVLKSAEDESHVYMWGLDGQGDTLYVVDSSWIQKRKYSKIKHSGLFAARPALSAGKIDVGKNGRWLSINWASGHYRPEMNALALTYQWMKDVGFNTSSLDWKGRWDWNQFECAKQEWDQMAISGYDSRTLEGACIEATTGPTFMTSNDN